MEIFTLLETMENILAGSRAVPFTDKVVVDREEMLEMIKEIRLKLPEDLKQAKWVREERTRIMQEAQKEAENRIISMIDEHEITRKAYEEKAKIIDTAHEMSREMSEGTKSYADNILGDVETTIETLQRDVEAAQITIKDALETLKNNRKELK